MKKFIDLIKKYKTYILSILLLIFFFKSCSKSTDIKKLNKVNDINLGYSDSLQNVINYQKAKIDSIPEIIRIDKINIHLEYDEWISSKDRGSQLMELHTIVKNNIKELQKK
jgi:PBP1b-binding outer membrane lipoprotein LpoB